MREEVQRVIAEDGWTKAAIGKMHKVDSFLRESQRLHIVEPRAFLRNDFYFLPISERCVMGSHPSTQCVCHSWTVKHLIMSLVALLSEVVAPEGFTFTDGTTVPYGSCLGVSGMAIHYDEGAYALNQPQPIQG
jgi:hypothetical protein